MNSMLSLAHATLSTGAYVIRERVTAAALQIESPNIEGTSTKVTVAPQDESQFPDLQIWWVEPLAQATSDLCRGSVYSITNPCGYKALTGNADGTVSATQQRGATNQLWGLRTLIDTVTGARFYTMYNVATSHVLAIHYEIADSFVITQPVSPHGSNPHWEFVRPITAFPAGWVEIQNVASGDLISQDYDHNPAALLPPHSWPLESQFRDQWQYQWVLAHTKWCDPATAGIPNSWMIVNRLTRAPLHLSGASGSNRAWRLELDTRRNWKLVNLGSMGSLDQAGRGELLCQVVDITGRTSSWILKPPLRFTDTMETWAAGYDTE